MLAAAVACLLAGPLPAQTPAGTVIRNQAEVRYESDGRSLSANSNEVATRIDERIDLRLAPVVAVDPAAGTIPFILTNAGNGVEPFVITIPTLPAGWTVARIAPDRDGDGRADGTDALEAGRTAPFAVGASAAFVIVLAGAEGDTGTIVIKARAVTGAGTPGTIYAGAGDGGGDAVLGTTGGFATLTVPVASTEAAALVKRQTVLAPDGSDTAARGSIVTYELRAVLPAGTRAARIEDPVPAGTRYVAGSLRLDDAVVSDADDDDRGGCDGTAVAVMLGDAGATTVRTIQFQVIIQ